MTDIRWKQRFSNYRKALSQLRKFIDKGQLSDLEKQGLVKAFEYTYELAWNVIKDFYEAQGETNIQGSKDAFRLAFSRGLVRDGDVWTSAGVTAGIDMALGMVEMDAGREIAMSVAKKLVVFYKRPGGQSQFSSALLEQSAGDARIGELHRWMGARLRSTLNVARLAEQLTMTPRTFARFYLRQTGTTPARAVEQMRLERACRLIEARQRLSVKAIAQQCGFSSEEIMRRSFLRHLHVSPTEYRERFSAAA